MYKLNLSVQDRIYLLALMPVVDSIQNLLLKKEIKAKIQITEDESKEINLKVEASLATWDQSAKDKTIELSKKELDYITSSMNRLSERSSFPEDMLNLYVKLSEQTPVE